MKFHIIFRTVLFVVFIFLFNCAVLEKPASFSNPQDPDDADYTEPSVNFISIPDTSGFLDTCKVYFEWQGIEDFMTFSYRMDSSEWSGWASNVTSVTYPFMDEGEHTFQILSRYQNTVERSSPQEISFIVNDIAGPAVLLIPRYLTVADDSVFSIEVMVDEVEALAGINAVIGFSDYFFNLVSVEIYEDERSIFLQNGGSLISFYGYNNWFGTVEIEAGVAAGSPSFVSGTGVIAKMSFFARNRGTTQIYFKSQTELRDENNNPVTLENKISTIIKVQ